MSHTVDSDCSPNDILESVSQAPIQLEMRGRVSLFLPIGLRCYWQSAVDDRLAFMESSICLFKLHNPLNVNPHDDSLEGKWHHIEDLDFYGCLKREPGYIR